MDRKKRAERFILPVRRIHARTPGLNKLPFRSLAIIGLLIVVNAVTWAIVGVVLSDFDLGTDKFNTANLLTNRSQHFYPDLSGTAILAWTLGLRHALDADHISAIDLMTRRLLASGRKAVTVGTFFSLGHSTIVIITSIVVAATASAISKNFNSFSYIGGIIGSSISSAFLLLLGAANAWILSRLIRRTYRLLHPEIYEREQHSQDPNDIVTDPSNPSPAHAEAQIETEDDQIKLRGGPILRLTSKLFKLVDRPWKMYPLGVLFGLGFDTSSQVALLGISSVQSAKGTSFWVILIFPILFTVGMCLLDTADGALMFGLYWGAMGGRVEVVSGDGGVDSSEGDDVREMGSAQVVESCAAEGSGSKKAESNTFASATRTSVDAPTSKDSTTMTSDLSSSKPSPTTTTHIPPKTTSTQPNRPMTPTATTLYYNTLLTSLTVAIALVIGVIQLLSLVDSVSSPSGKFWDGVRSAGDYYDVIGGCICGAFAIVGVGAVVFHGRWIAYVERKRAERIRGVREGVV